MEEMEILYRGAYKASDLKPSLNPYQRASALSKSKELALASVKLNLDLLPQDDNLYPFYQKNPLFWIIPIELIDGQVIEFLLRGYKSKDFYRVCPTGTPALFGWTEFDFYEGETIILTEGYKDGVVLKQGYPFVLSALTVMPTKSWIGLLAKIAKALIIATDRDGPGEKVFDTVRSNPDCLGKPVFRLRPPGHDFGELLDNTKNIDQLVYSFLKPLKSVLNV